MQGTYVCVCVSRPCFYVFTVAASYRFAKVAQAAVEAKGECNIAGMAQYHVVVSVTGVCEWARSAIGEAVSVVL